ncbi:hypothetical protein B0H65DRAFT_446703 [Neurospora tetraspora]|uniref:Uncharacterized protein n=1 Tax=Neurospora tetraspora TaxID=94610 RepID=A0AAE0J158_9PEZI|nr:hypothetical protein B0H65DRAFT_446703 [Neurospora tetraspora]
MRLTHLVTLSLLGLSTASVINPQARSSSATVAISTLNHTTSESASSLQTSPNSPDLPSMARVEPSPPPSPPPPSPPPANNNAAIIDDDVNMTDFDDDEDQNENTQHHGGHGGHGGHGRAHSMSTSSHTGTSSGGDGS